MDNFNFAFRLGELEITKLDLTIVPDDLTIDYGDPIINMTYQFNFDKSSISSETANRMTGELKDAYHSNVLTELTITSNEAFYKDSTDSFTPNSFYISKSAYLNAQALALVNAQALALVNLYPGQTRDQLNAQALALVNAQALALVNAQALALVNAQALALVNAQALALVNAQALALVNGESLESTNINAQALALVNAKTLMNAQALALVNAEPFEGGNVNAQALALVNAQALALVNNSSDFTTNAQALALVNAQALALVNGTDFSVENAQALALVNAQALALVNLYPDKTMDELTEEELAQVNAQALALVNEEVLQNAQALALVNLYPDKQMEDLSEEELAEVNAQALALVNAQALALVNAQALALVNAQALALVNLYPDKTMDDLSPEELAAVNAQALALVNAQALALVNQVEGQLNASSFNDVYNNNEDAIIILTIEDIEAMRQNNNSTELLSVNIVSGNTVTNANEPHKIAPGAFMAKNFNVQYGLGNLTVNPSPVKFELNDSTLVYDGNSHTLNLNSTFKERFDDNGNPYVVTPEVLPYTISYKDAAGNIIEGNPVNAGTYTVVINIDDVNYGFIDSNNPPTAKLVIEKRSVVAEFENTTQVYNGTPREIGLNLTSLPQISSEGYELTYFYNNDDHLTAPINSGEYLVTLNLLDQNFKVDSLSESTTTLVITKAPVSFTFENTIQIYSGSPKSVNVIPSSETVINNEAFEITYFYNGQFNLVGPTDAGEYNVVVNIVDQNFKLDTLGHNTTDLIIKAAPLAVIFSELTQTYTGLSLGVNVSTNPALPASDFILTYFYDGQDNARGPIDAGIYPVTLELVNQNYVLENETSGTVNFTINAAPLSFDFQNLTQVYTGSALSPDVNPLYLSPTDSTADWVVYYNGESSAPSDAGEYNVSVEIMNSNYIVDASTGALTAVFTIEKAIAELTFTNTSTIYNGSQQGVTVNTVPSGILVNTEYFYDNQYTIEPPVNVGSYDVNVSILNNNYQFSSGSSYSTVFEILPASVDVSFTNISVVYSGYPQEVELFMNPQGVDFELSYYYHGILLDSPPSNVGDYEVKVKLVDSNYIFASSSSNTTVFSINKAELNVYADSKVINAGNPLPDYTFTYSGFVGVDDAYNVFGSSGAICNAVNPSTSTVYNLNSGPGEYVLELNSIDNYNFVYPEQIFLFVNPDKKGTKAIVPSLDCVTKDGNGNYTAYFSYENKNNIAVYVLLGTDNIVTGGGNSDLSQQPTKFEPGGGEWSATFDGSQMVWTVTSRNHGHNTSNAQDASSNSKNCNTLKSASISGKTALPELEDVTEIYPNPVQDKLNVVLNNTDIIKDAKIYNIMGKNVFVNVNRIADHKVILDMSSLISGIYILKIQVDTRIKVFQIIKK